MGAGDVGHTCTVQYIHSCVLVCCTYIRSYDGGTMLFTVLTVDTVDIDRDNDTDNGGGGRTDGRAYK